MHPSAIPAQLPVLLKGSPIHNLLIFQYPLQDSNL